jgi:SSS family solute:Na+ symporter
MNTLHTADYIVFFGYFILIFAYGIMVIMSLIKPEANPKKLMEVDVKLFRVSPGFLFGSLIIIGILIALYTVFW